MTDNAGRQGQRLDGLLVLDVVDDVDVRLDPCGCRPSVSAVVVEASLCPSSLLPPCLHGMVGPLDDDLFTPLKERSSKGESLHS